MSKVWIKQDHNSILYGDKSEEWWISYNPSSTVMWGSATGFYGDSEDETAIVSKYGFHILNGDWRHEYEELISKGLTSCLSFYSEHPEDWSSWTNDLPKLKQLTAPTKAKGAENE